MAGDKFEEDFSDELEMLREEERVMEDCYGDVPTSNNAATPSSLKNSSVVKTGSNNVYPSIPSSSSPSQFSVLCGATSPSSSNGGSRHSRKRTRGTESGEEMNNSKHLRSSMDVNNTWMNSPGLGSRNCRTLPGQDISDDESDTFARETKEDRVSDGGGVGGGEGMWNGRNGCRNRKTLDNSEEGSLNFDYNEDIGSHDDVSVSSLSHKTILSDPRGLHEPMSEDKLSWTCVLPRAPTCPHLSVTGSEGKRVFLRIMDVESVDIRERCKVVSHSWLKLLTVPFAELKAVVEEERRRNLMTESEDLLDTLASSHHDDQETQPLFDSEMTSEMSKGVQGSSGSGHLLWVDKYTPKLYTELLSDDGINRTLLSWLRLWDEVVFGSPTPLKNAGPADGGLGSKTKGSSALNIGGGGGGGSGDRGGRKFEKRVDYQNVEAFSSVEALDESKRPKLKLALLCGPPGLGKTTLAHIIAKHAGYNVVEMNASDDRSLEVFSQKIEAATQMKAVLTVDKKPNCLIIDEIDGAPTAAINFLVDLVKQKHQGMRRARQRLLSRPIICICNNQYTPALRQLRQTALLLHFPPTITSRLAFRLQQVVKKEGLKASMPTLMALCEKADNEVRTCLNSIQFMGRKHRDLTLGLVQSTSIGQKDAQGSVFSLWKDVFQLPSMIKKQSFNRVPLEMVINGGKSNAGTSKSVNSNFIRFYSILSAASSVGEYLRVTDGLFENYLLVKFRDPGLEALSLGQDWLVFQDLLQHRISLTQDYSVMPYLPYLSVLFHFLYASSARPQIKYPNNSYEMTVSHQRNHQLISSLMLGMPPAIQRNVSPTNLSLEILPPLCEIISPSFRPVNTQLYSAQEKHQLSDLVDTMISYSLIYKQERGPDGQYTYILDPNVDDITRFSGLPQRKQLTYAAKQLIAREIDIEKLRRAEHILTSKFVSSSDERSKGKTRGGSENGGKKRIEIAKKPFVPVIKEVTHGVDFFGRKIPAKAGRTKSRNTVGPTHPLWFRFNEGFSNAVRRPILIKDLI